MTRRRFMYERETRTWGDVRGGKGAQRVVGYLTSPGHDELDYLAGEVKRAIVSEEAIG